MSESRKNILFLCTGNACRSQMAEGWGRHLRGDEFNFYSAGIEIHGLNPNAVAVMAEMGVDISQHQSKTVEKLPVPMDLVVTVCGHANETCPVFLGAPRILHVGFDDPPKLAAAEASVEDGLRHYRRVRDEIKIFVSEFMI